MERRNRKFAEYIADTKVTLKNNYTKKEIILKDKQEYKETSGMDYYPAYVSVRASSVINMGNFENGKIEIGISLPCHEEEIDSTYERGKNWVDTRLGKEVAELRQYADERKKQSI